MLPTDNLKALRFLEISAQMDKANFADLVDQMLEG